MISRLYRFHGHSSLGAVYRRGDSVRGSLLSLKYMARPKGGNYRAAVVVSRKVSKSAVVRNQIRRRIYEIIRADAANLGGQDLVFTAFSADLADIEQSKLIASVHDLLSKTGITSPDTNSSREHAIVKTEGKTN